MSPRRKILALLHGERPATPPVFHGLVHVTAAGLQREGIALSESHTEVHRLAGLAASTFRLTGLPSACVPFDLCLEAEALGAAVDFREPGSLDLPRVSQQPYGDIEFLAQVLRSFNPGADPMDLARIPVVRRTIKQLKSEIGDQAIVGGILAGPFTVLSMLVKPPVLYSAMKQHPELVRRALSLLASFISRVGNAYHAAGADLITVHEMSGSPGLLGRQNFELIVFRPLSQLVDELPSPVVLAVCGKLEGLHTLLGKTRATALSIDQSNDLAAIRNDLPAALLFGNVDPVGVLSLGNPEDVRAAARQATRSGADAIWPGCDLVPATPIENIKALMEGSGLSG